MINITTGNLMHIYGCFAEKVDYTGRVTVRMYDPVDAGILARALDKTRQRYPYFSLQIRKNESETRGRSLYTTRMAESVSAQPKQTTTFGLSVIMMTISTWTPFTV